MSFKFTKKELLAEIDYFVKEYVSGSKIYFNEGEAKRLVQILKSLDKWSTSMNYANHFVINTRTTKGRRYKCLNIKQHNGRLIPVTKTAVRQLGNTISKRSMVLSELRRVVEPQIVSYRNTMRKFHSGYGKIHVDHDIKPFIQLACEWVIESGWSTFEDVPGRKTRGNKWVFPNEVAQDWYEYHGTHAKLQILDAKINLAESSRGYTAPF